jgi:hypothetical protein
MKTHNTQQEVLLVTGSRFAGRQGHLKKSTDTESTKAVTEQLKEACWNGLLKEILPEVFALARTSNELYMWQIRESDNYFTMEMGEFPEPLDYFFSIDPYAFMRYACAN